MQFYTREPALHCLPLEPSAHSITSDWMTVRIDRSLFFSSSLSFFSPLHHLPSLHLVPFLAFLFPMLGAIIQSTGNALSLWPQGIEGPSQTVCLSAYALLTVQKHLLFVLSWNISSWSLNRVPVLSSLYALDLNEDEFCWSRAESGLDTVCLGLGLCWCVSDLDQNMV